MPEEVCQVIKDLDLIWDYFIIYAEDITEMFA